VLATDVDRDAGCHLINGATSQDKYWINPKHIGVSVDECQY
jgi:hypothetical protein